MTPLGCMIKHELYQPKDIDAKPEKVYTTNQLHFFYAGFGPFHSNEAPKLNCCSYGNKDNMDCHVKWIC